MWGEWRTKGRRGRGAELDGEDESVDRARRSERIARVEEGEGVREGRKNWEGTCRRRACTQDGQGNDSEARWERNGRAEVQDGWIGGNRES